MLVVTDNSPLTALALADLLHLLKARWPLVIVPQAVWDESRHVGDSAALARLDAARTEGWLEIRHATQVDEVARLRPKLPVTGTLGLLIWAKVSGRVRSLRSLIDLVESRGEPYLSQELKESALAAVGE